MSPEAFAAFVGAPAKDRLDLFLTTANRLGTPLGNVEKDLWVCWTLDTLYHRLQAAQKLLEAARILDQAPGAMQLRYLSTLNVLGSEKSSTIVFPFPMELLDFFARSAGQDKS